MTKHNNLFTDLYKKMDKENPLSEYPYPNFKRSSYLSLNGNWKYKISKKENDFNGINNDILVPFPIESYASKVGTRLAKGEKIIYKKNFKLSKAFLKKHTFIHFLGVDQTYYIILNGHQYDEVTPLNFPTKIDISNSVLEDNELIVVAKDDLNPIYPLGKQSKNPKGIFYTPFSGIYYPVFIESVDDNFINDLKITTTMDTVSLKIDSKAKEFEITIREGEKEIIKETINQHECLFTIPNPKVWNLDEPFLYDLIIETDTDQIKSYFGLREIKQVDGFIYLNNQKVFLNGVLDQGYYPEGIITPVSYESYEFDILTMKELGFNTLRKHIKVELPYFYYLCDKHGMLVFQDFVNNGKYNFFKDTALPTIGLQVKDDRKDNKNPESRQNFIASGEKLINYLNNYPSIVGYTIFNEGWGQFDSNNVYHHFKKLYPNLIFDTASGWYRGAQTDLDSYHWYFKNIDKLPKMDHPVFLSEFGALCYKVSSHCFGERHVFGYKYFPSIDQCEDAFARLYEKKIIPYKDKLIGTIYTQLSDVEEEDNGLLTYDRKVLKFNKERVQEVLKKLK